MKLSVFLSTATFASSILAAPRHERALAKGAQRGARSAHRRNASGNVTSNAATDVISSDNWSGGVIQAAAGETYNSVSGTLPVPTIDSPGNTEDIVRFWVGIDGLNEPDPVIQAGVEVYEAGDGTVEYSAWYEWFPAGLTYFEDDQFTVAGGDVVTVTVTVATGSSTGATAVLENTTSGQKVTQNFDAPSSDNVANGLTAEWIAERIKNVDETAYLPLLNFGQYTFSNINAAFTSGNAVDLNFSPVTMVDADSGDALADGGLNNPGEVLSVWQAAS